jgi:hypothetical protein|tara:strand:+ start:2304 stop:2528 length:225 start_codon:yes stop_codon:yes gene_type:complete
MDDYNKVLNKLKNVEPSHTIFYLYLNDYLDIVLSISKEELSSLELWKPEMELNITKDPIIQKMEQYKKLYLRLN